MGTSLQSLNVPAAQLINLNEPLILQPSPFYYGRLSAQPTTYALEDLVQGVLPFHCVVRHNCKIRSASPHTRALAAETMGVCVGTMRFTDR